MSTHEDTGQRRRTGDVPASITDLIDEPTVQNITQEAWSALIGEDEFLVPLPGGLPDDAVSAWVEIVGPWTGAVVLTCDRTTAEELTRCLLAEHAHPVLDEEDVADGLGELANVVGGNVKAVLPGPSVLGLPDVGSPPEPGSDTLRAELLWRGQTLTVTLQGSSGALTTQQNDPHKNEVPL